MSPIDTPVMHVTERFYKMLGFARKAGKTVHGTEVICDRMRAKKKLVLVLISQEASSGTQDKISHICRVQSVPFYVVESSKAQFQTTCGYAKPLGAIGITDDMFKSVLEKELTNS